MEMNRGEMRDNLSKITRDALDALRFAYRGENISLSWEIAMLLIADWGMSPMAVREILN